jgi:hypothetical protein
MTVNCSFDYGDDALLAFTNVLLQEVSDRAVVTESQSLRDMRWMFLVCYAVPVFTSAVYAWTYTFMGVAWYPRLGGSGSLLL